MSAGMVASFARSGMQIEYDLAGIIALLGPVALVYSWYFYVSKIGKQMSWRNGITLSSLALLPAGTLLWPVTMALAPKANWSTYAGVVDQVNFVETWEKLAVRTISVALVLCFFGLA